MAIEQITLTEAENRALRDLSQNQNTTPEEILHRAVAQFLNQHQVENPSENRLAALRQARGIWHERQDLPDASELRREWDRF